MARPNLSYLKNLTIVLIGAGVGIWSGLTGTGAGLLLTPMLKWLVALKDRALVGASLVTATLAAVFALLAYGQDHLVTPGPALMFAVANGVGVRCGSARTLEPVRRSRTASLIWSIATLAIACWLMYGAFHGQFVVPAHALPVRHWAGMVVGGLLSGVAGRLGGLGGLLSVPCLLIIAGDSALSAQATALTALLMVSAIPAIAVVARHSAPGYIIAWATFGAILGAMVGSRIAVGLPSPRLILIYGAGMYIVGAVRLLAQWPREGGR